MLLGAFLLASALQCPDGTPPPCSARPARVAVAPAAANAVAVLYFDNLSRDSADAYLADGLTEELIARLGQVERLSVKSRGAVRRYRGAAETDPATLGRALGVASLVSGSVQRSGARLRVRVEMVRAATGVRMWGEVYERGDGDVFAIQEDIARAVVTQVAGRLAPAERATISSRPTRSAEAYDRFLRGNYLLSQRKPGFVRLAIEEYQAAARLDPQFTSALARIALAHGVYLSWGWQWPGLTVDSLLERGYAAARRAVAQDSANADAWFAMGTMLEQRNPRTLEGAFEANRRGLALDPRNAEGHHLAGWMLVTLGQDSLAVTEYRRALALDPARAITLEHLARLAMIHRRDDDARALLDSAIQVDAGFVQGYIQRAMLHARRGELFGARRDAVMASALGGELPTWIAAVTARVELAAGDSAPARARLAQLQRDTSEAIGAWIVVVPALLAAGDTAAALDMMDFLTSRPRFTPTAATWMRGPNFDAVRSSARFQRIMERAQIRPVR